MSTDVVSQVLLLVLLLTQDLVQVSGLDEVDVAWRSSPVEWLSWTVPDFLVLLDWSVLVWNLVLLVGSVVVWFVTEVTINVHWTVSNNWVEELGGVWAVDRDLVEVSTQSVTVSISVSKQTRL